LLGVFFDFAPLREMLLLFQATWAGPEGHGSTPARCASATRNCLRSLVGRGLRVWNPRSRVEHKREQKKLVVRYLLATIGGGLTGGTFSYSFARCPNSSSRLA
jgi:hypothetical protein